LNRYFGKDKSAEDTSSGKLLKRAAVARLKQTITANGQLETIVLTDSGGRFGFETNRKGGGKPVITVA